MLDNILNLEGVTVLNKKQQINVIGGNDNAHVIQHCHEMYPTSYPFSLFEPTDEQIRTILANVEPLADCISAAYS